MVRRVEQICYECEICGEVYLYDYEAEECEADHRRDEKELGAKTQENKK